MKTKLIIPAALMAVMLAAAGCGNTAATQTGNSTQAVAAADSAAESQGENILSEVNSGSADAQEATSDTQETEAANEGSETTENSAASSEQTGGSVNSSEEAEAVKAEATSLKTSEMFTERDLTQDYETQGAVSIKLNGSTASADSDSVTVSDGTVTISKEGVYIVSGTLNDGMIVVNAADTEKVQIVLDNANITSKSSAAIYVLSADKVFVTTAAGTTNTLTNGGSFTAIDENNIDAVIYSKDDLVLNGKGTLVIESPAGHGAVSKDSLKVTGGTYEITAASHGLSGKDDVRIADGTFTIKSGKDGIHAENTDDTTLGFVYIQNGSYKITAEGDGISGESYVQIEDGDFDITAGGGSENAEAHASNQFGGRGGRGGMNGRENGGMNHGGMGGRPGGMGGNGESGMAPSDMGDGSNMTPHDMSGNSEGSNGFGFGGESGNGGMGGPGGGRPGRPGNSSGYSEDGSLPDMTDTANENSDASLLALSTDSTSQNTAVTEGIELTSGENSVDQSGSEEESTGILKEKSASDSGNNIFSGAGNSGQGTANTDNSGANASSGDQASADSAAADDGSTSTKGIKATGALTINGGTFKTDTADDAVHSNASVTVNGGSFEIKTGDDGFHSDETLTFNGGTVNITESYEGLEGMNIEVNDGDITLKATDDGLNAAGGTDQSGFGGYFDQPAGMAGQTGRGGNSASGNYSLVINGGTLKITASGDALDSNGTLEITGGEVITSGPSSGDTSILDFVSSGSITGGTFIGTGSSGMSQGFTNAAQGVINTQASGKAGTKLTVTDANGKEIISVEPELDFNTVIISSPDLVSGNQYTLTVGTQSTTVTAQ